MSYRGYLIRRTASIIPVFFGVSMLIFVLARVIPGAPARQALGPRATDESVQQLRENLGLDEPVWVQYYNYMSGLLRGDMGQSLTTGQNVLNDLIEFFPATFELTTIAMLVAILFGVPLGVYAGQNKDQFGDNVSRGFSFFAVSLPRFWAGILLQLLIAFHLGLLPSTGRIADGIVLPVEVTGLLLIDSTLAWNVPAFVSASKHLVLPAVTLALAPMADIARLTRSSFIEEFNQDYVEGLRTHGLPEKLIAYKYVLKKSFASTLTIIGLDYGALLGSAFLVEIVFAWPGMARYGVQAILQTDINAIVGVTLVVSLGFLLANLLVDILYGYFDPRVRFRSDN